MGAYYNSELDAAEHRLIQMGSDMERLRKEFNEERERYRRNMVDSDATAMRKYVAQIQQYDEQVQQIISASPILQEAWDNFRVQYQLTANKELLETAREKMSGRKDGICHGCKRAFGDTCE